MDGYWQSLRKHGGHRGINTMRRQALSNCVLLHSWAQWAGPSTDMLQHLGQTLLTYRALQGICVDAALGAADQDDFQAGPYIFIHIHTDIHISIVIYTYNYIHQHITIHT